MHSFPEDSKGSVLHVEGTEDARDKDVAGFPYEAGGTQSVAVDTQPVGPGSSGVAARPAGCHIHLC